MITILDERDKSELNTELSNKEDKSNKVQVLNASANNYPSANAVKEYVDDAVDSVNESINNIQTSADGLIQQATYQADRAKTNANLAETNANLAENSVATARGIVSEAQESAQDAEAAKVLAQAYRDQAAAIATPDGLAAQVAQNADNITSIKNNYIKVSSTQPSSTDNKMWVNPNTERVGLVTEAGFNRLSESVTEIEENLHNVNTKIIDGLGYEESPEFETVTNRIFDIVDGEVTPIETLYNYYKSAGPIDLTGCVKVTVTSKAPASYYQVGKKPMIILTDSNGQIVDSVDGDGNEKTVAFDISTQKNLYINASNNFTIQLVFLKLSEYAAKKTTEENKAELDEKFDGLRKGLAFSNGSVQNIHPLILDMATDYWWNSIYPMANNNNDGYFSITGNAGDGFVTVTGYHDLDIATIPAEMSNARNMCVVYDDGTVKPVNMWYRDSSSINIFPNLERDITDGKLATFQLNDIHLTQTGYVGYAQMAYRSNVKHLDKSESLYRFRPKYNYNNKNKSCAPFVPFGRVTSKNVILGQSGQSIATAMEYTIGYSESNFDNDVDSGFEWEVDLDYATGYVEAYVGLGKDRSVMTFTYADEGKEMLIDLWLDGVLAKSIKKYKYGLERICIDFSGAKKAKLVIHKKSWIRYNVNFTIGNVTWYKNHGDYSGQLIPKFATPVVLFDSWSNMGFPAAGAAIKDLMESDCGFKANLYDESLGGSTCAWARQWFYDKVLARDSDHLAEQYDSSKSYKYGERCVYKGELYSCAYNTSGDFDPTKWAKLTRKKIYKPTHVLIDHVLNDKGTASGSTRYSTDSPTREQYQFSTTHDEYLRWMKDLVDMAISNGIQPIIFGANKRAYHDWYFDLVDYLDTASYDNMDW